MTSTTTDLTVLDNLDTARTVADVEKIFSSLGVNPYDNEADGIRSLDVVEDKDRLIKTPFMLLRWRFNQGDMGEFVSAELMLGDGTLLVLNDGSTGIMRQLKELTEHRENTGHATPTAGRFVRNGLRKSEYEVEDAKGNVIPATTFYLSY